MDQMALLVQNPHVLNHVQVKFIPLLLVQVYVFQFRRRLHLFTDEFHHQYVTFHLFTQNLQVQVRATKSNFSLFFLDSDIPFQPTF